MLPTNDCELVGASVPALANAVLDALKPLGVRKLEMPYTPDRIWQAIQQPAGA